MPSIDLPGRPSAFIPSSWKRSSTRALTLDNRAPPSMSSRSIGVKKLLAAGFTPAFLAVSVARYRAGAPESTRKLNGPLPLIRTRTRKWLVSVR